MQREPHDNLPAAAVPDGVLSAQTLAALNDYITALQQLASLPPAEMAREAARLRDERPRPVLSPVQREAVMQLLHGTADGKPITQAVVAEIVGLTPQAISKMRAKYEQSNDET